MCYMVPFVELSVSHASVLTILAITVERYYAICLPLQAGAVWTKSKGEKSAGKFDGTHFRMLKCI